MKSAAKPTPVPIPREEKRINAQTSAGIFLRNVAKPLTTFASFGNGETFSLPKSAVKNAKTAAIVVEERASASVTRMQGRDYG